jgi:hypothetical protein
MGQLFTPRSAFALPHNPHGKEVEQEDRSGALKRAPASLLQVRYSM